MSRRLLDDRSATGDAATGNAATGNAATSNAATVVTVGGVELRVEKQAEFDLNTSSDEEDGADYAQLSEVEPQQAPTLPVSAPPESSHHDPIVLHALQELGEEEKTHCCQRRFFQTSRLQIVNARREVFANSNGKTVKVLLEFLKLLSSFSQDKGELPAQLTTAIKEKRELQQVIFDLTTMLVVSRVDATTSKSYVTNSVSLKFAIQVGEESDLESPLEIAMSLWASVFKVANDNCDELRKLNAMRSAFQTLSIAGACFIGMGLLPYCILISLTGYDKVDSTNVGAMLMIATMFLGSALVAGGLFFSKRAECAGGVSLTDAQMFKDSTGEPLIKVRNFMFMPKAVLAEGRSDSDEDATPPL